jgi:hypothetical protein
MLVLAVCWLVRLLTLAILPYEAMSLDLLAWVRIAKILLPSGNPSHDLWSMNWPPLWMLLDYTLSIIAGVLQTPLIRVVRHFLIASELALIVVLYRILSAWFPKKNAASWLMWGIALNPVSVLLICQHGNHDVLIVLWSSLALLALLRFQKSHDVTWWLWGALFLGLGVMTKTIPVLLSPLLLIGTRSFSWREYGLGLALLAGPSVVGLAVLNVVGVDGVVTHVLTYRSFELGFFGFPSLLRMLHAEAWLGLYSQLFMVGTLAAVIFVSSYLRSLDVLEPRRMITGAALAFCWIPTLGSSVAFQYLYWPLPFLAASYGLWDRPWRILLWTGWVVSSVTYFVEYALHKNYGAFLLYAHPTPPVIAWSQRFSTLGNFSLAFRLPLFFILLAIFMKGIRLMIDTSPRSRPSAAA